MPRFFVEQAVGDTDTGIRLAPDDARHILQVLRMKPGDVVDVCDDHHRLYRCRIPGEAGAAADARGVLTVEILERLPGGGEFPFEITLYQGLPKGEKMNLIVRECIELGAARIVPVLCRRSVSRPDAAKSRAKAGRWQKVAEAAAKQSGRGRMPQVSEPMTFEAALAEAGARHDRIFVPYESETAVSIRAFLEPQPRPDRLAFFIGPEGGFAADEVAAFDSAGIPTVTLGPRILRTETAGAAVLSMLSYRFEMA